ncbi:MAG TPA: hypothetical protein VF120_04520 [Ktedonobacterales bacterium]
MPSTAALIVFGAGVVLGVIVVLVLRVAFASLRGRGGAYSGTWEQTLTGGHGSLRARDAVTCRQSGDELRGTIRRVEPSVEDYKEWRFAGHIHGGLAVCAYWGADPQRLPGDFGTLQLALADAEHATGVMTKRPVSQDGKRFEGEPLETQVVWARPSARSEAKLSAAATAEAHKAAP